MRKHLGTLGAILLLLIFATELILSVRQQSLSWDEGDHIFAGYQAWKTADFGINPEHPPFVKELATLPLLTMHLRTPPPKHLAFFKDEAYFDGRDLIFDNGGLATAERIIFRVRMFAASLSILLGVLVYLGARELWGEAAGLFALALVVFEPNLIAHGAYVTTDMGITCFMFATIYTLYRFIERPSWPRLVLLGVATGLALASKHSAVLLLPIVFVLVLVELIRPPAGLPRRALAGCYAVACSGAAAIGLLILWSTYGFRFSAHPGGVSMSPSLAEYIRPLHGIEPRIYLLLARLHVLPESYIYGLADVRIVSDWFPTYLFGRVHAHGVPYYFPAAFIIKSTAAFMALMLLAAFALAARKLPLNRKVFCFAIPPLVYLLIAIGTGLNIGARHILPMYPFLAVLIAGAVVTLARANRRWGYAAAVLLLWHAVSTTRAYPLYIAYSNEFWGGPSQTYRYLTDSNVDWGQQLLHVKSYLDRRGITHCWFGYFVQPEIDFRAYGIPCRPLPTADTFWSHTQVDTPETIQGPVLVSAGTLTGYEFGSVVLSPYRQFLSLHPDAVIEDGVFVFNGNFNVRFASAFGHVTRADGLFAVKQYPAALDEAQQAAAIDPDEFQAQMILGDTLAALHRSASAAAAYTRALAIAHTMEPSAQADWIPQIQSKLKAL